MASSKTSKARLEAEEIRKQILALRLSGATVRQVADQVGRAPSTVHQHLKTALNRSIEQNDADANQLREVELLRMDYYLRQLDPKIRTSDVKAIGEARRLSESRRRLLGIDAPQEIKVLGLSDIADLFGVDEDEIKAAMEDE